MIVSIPFNMQNQQQPNWCWAAVSTSVALYYRPQSGWSQCQVANRQLQRNDCCGSGASGPCNVYGYLDQALTDVGHFSHLVGSSVAFAAVTQEISNRRPFCLRVAWAGGGAHFIAAIGTATFPGLPFNLILIADSIYGNSIYFYGSKYRNSGTWTTSYFTKP